jgi:N-acetylglutamate synthase
MKKQTRLIEELSMNAWPSMQTHLYDGWVLRFSEGYTKRANSINPLYPSSLAMEEKITACESLYEDKKLPATFKIIGTEQQTELEKELICRGYGKLDETAVMTASLRSFKCEASPSLVYETAFTDAWSNGFIACNAINPAYETVLRKMLDCVPGEKIIISKRLNGVIAACGFGVMERGYVGLFDIVVDKTCRGKGIGKEVVQSILGRAKEEGAETAYLQVLKGNVVAENLYGKLGFEESYRYWYRKK